MGYICLLPYGRMKGLYISGIYGFKDRMDVRSVMMNDELRKAYKEER